MRSVATIRLGALVLALILVVGPTATSDEGKGEDPQLASKPVRSHDGKFSLSLPATWTVEVRKKGPATSTRVLRLRVRVPQLEGTLKLSVFHTNGVAAPLQQAYTERPVLYEREKADRAWVERLPSPHLHVEFKRGDAPRRLVHVYRMIRGNGFTLVAAMPSAMWEPVSEHVLAAISTLEAKVDAWPRPPPESYRVSRRDGYVYYAHPAAKKKDVATYHKALKKLEKSFQKRHGRFKVGQDNAASILFHDTRRRAMSVDSEAANHRTGHLHKLQQRRVFAVPLDLKSRNARGDFNYALWGLFFWLRYGCAQPDWMYEGETMLANEHGRTRHALPGVTQWLWDQPPIPRRFDELDLLQEEDYEAYRKTCTLYVALFRIGPAKYRSAYKQFVKALGEGQDWGAAGVEHLLGLDQAELQEEARKLHDFKLTVRGK